MSWRVGTGRPIERKRSHRPALPPVDASKHLEQRNRGTRLYWPIWVWSKNKYRSWIGTIRVARTRRRELIAAPNLGVYPLRVAAGPWSCCLELRCPWSAAAFLLGWLACSLFLWRLRGGLAVLRQLVGLAKLFDIIEASLTMSVLES